MMDDPDNKQVNDWMRILDLKPHVEGGYYCETYRSNDHCKIERDNNRIYSCSSAIYYLLKTPESPKSHFHRIKADEIWHFYKGLPLTIHVLDEENSSHIEHVLNNELDVNTSARPQILIPHGKWFAAEILLSDIQDKRYNYTLCGCTCTPAFDFGHFELAKRSYLLSKFPNLKDIIIRLTASE